VIVNGWSLGKTNAILANMTVRFGERGALLLEVIFGMMLFLIAFVMVLSVFPIARSSANLGKDRSVANNLAKDFLERERALPYDQVGINATGPVSVPIKSTANGVTSETVYQVEILVAELEPGRRKAIRSIVKWGSAEHTHEVLLETFKVSYPVLVGP
jgi:hypothetical protein